MIPIEDLTSELQNIYAFCSTGYNEKDGNELTERLTQLSVYLARSAVLQGNAQYHYDKKQGEESEIAIKNFTSLTPTMLAKIISGKCASEAKLLKLAERLNRTITHQMDALRSQLSYCKSLPQ